MNVGVKTSRSKINVLTAKPYELSYSSAFDTLKVYKKGAGSASLTFGTPTQIVIDHGLGYRPAFLVFSEIGVSDGGAAGKYFLLPFSYPVGGDSSVMPYVTKAALYIRYGADMNPDTVVYNYRYFIFYNRAVPPYLT